jgi:hypothetical protein
MASYYSSITDEQAALIRNASLFFVATADLSLGEGPRGVGPLNLSPKGGVTLHILTPNHVAFLDYAGSGNETARHSISGGPVTVMICSFEEENAAIVRLYGKARVTAVADSPIGEQLLKGKVAHRHWRSRNVVEIAIESTMTSCGYGVPVLKFVRDRAEEDRGDGYK